MNQPTRSFFSWRPKRSRVHILNWQSLVDPVGTGWMDFAARGPRGGDELLLSSAGLLTPASCGSGWEWAGSTRRVTDPTQKTEAIGPHGPASNQIWVNGAGLEWPIGSVGPTHQ